MFLSSVVLPGSLDSLAGYSRSADAHVCVLCYRRAVVELCPGRTALVHRHTWNSPIEFQVFSLSKKASRKQAEWRN